MTDIAFNQRPRSIGDLGLDPEALQQFCQANSLVPQASLGMCRAYTLSSPSAADSTITNYLNSLPTWQRYSIVDITNLAQDESIALAKFTHRYFTEENMNKINSFVGAAATAAGARLNGFETKIVEYQQSLKDLWQLTRNHRSGRGNAAAKQKARAKVRQAYTALEKAYALELKKFAPLAWRRKNRGDALNNAERGITLASRRPNSMKMDNRIKVANRVEASWLGHCSKVLKYAGNAALVVDAGLRAKEVSDIHDAGGDWMRESARQLAGFGLGGAAGIMAGTYTISMGTYIAAYSGLALAGPLGWSILGVIVATGLVAGFGAGVAGDKFGKAAADRVWNLQR